MRCVAVLLAAGGGSRFTGPTHKLVALLGDRPVWRHSLDHALAAGFEHVVVVTGAVDLLVPAHAPGAQVVHNARWAEGQATSLQCGLGAAADLGAEAVVIGLADQPFVPASAWAAVRDAPADAPIVIATYADGPGPTPVRLHRDIWPLLPTNGDLGAREVIRAHPEWVSRVACLGSVADIDTLEDLERWKSC